LRSILIDARRDPAELRLKLGLTVSRARFAATIADGIFAPAVDQAVRSDVTARAEDDGPRATSERAL
jgi:hypothetical protein